MKHDTAVLFATSGWADISMPLMHLAMVRVPTVSIMPAPYCALSRLALMTPPPLKITLPKKLAIVLPTTISERYALEPIIQHPLMCSCDKRRLEGVCQREATCPSAAYPKARHKLSAR